MTRTPEYHKTVNKVSADEFPVYLIEISHPNLPEPVRVCNNTENIVSNGDEFIALSFGIQPPTDPEDGIPQARLIIDNVGRVLTEWVELTRGGVGTQWRIMHVLPSDPDTIQWETTLRPKDLSMTQQEVSVGLGYQTIFNRSGLRKKYTPRTAPGLF